MPKRRNRRKERSKEMRKIKRRPRETNIRGAWTKVKAEVKMREVGRRRN